MTADDKKDCPTFTIYNMDDKSVLKEIPLKDVQAGKNIPVTAKYLGNGYKGKLLALSAKEKAFFQSHGRIIHDPKWNLTSYEGEGESNIDEWSFDEEWKSMMQAFGGDEQTYRRYPYNTVFITSDLLLHAYYKVFETNLKYYEQSFARKAVSKLSEEMFASFVAKAKQEKNADLKKYYNFLAAYRLIPSSLLMNEEKFL